MKTFIVKFTDSFQPITVRSYSRSNVKSKIRVFYKGRKVEYIEEQVQYASV